MTLRRTVVFLYVAIIVCMALATIVEKYEGTAFVQRNIYGAWWFSLLWAMLTAAGVAYFIKQRVKRAFVVVLHLSFVVILAGALLTHLTGQTGMIHLRIGETANQFLLSHDGKSANQPLPFTVRLDTFYIDYHEGTRSAADYVSQLTITDGNRQEHAEVSMNNIYAHRGIRFYQSSYDEDGRGTLLSVNSDPWGIPVTYTGYALLFISLLWMLIKKRQGLTPNSLTPGLTPNPSPRGEGRRYSHGRKTRFWVSSLLALSLSLLLITPLFLWRGVGGEAAGGGAPTLPLEQAQELGRLNILYNGRICPLQTFAIDFTKKLYGKPHYGQYSAEQVLTGFIFWGDEWCNEPIIKVKGEPLRSTLQLPKYCSVNSFFNPAMGGYTLGPYVQQYYHGNRDKFHQEVGKVDEKLQLIMELRQGKLLKVFPYTQHATTWYSPVDRYPADIQAEQQEYMKNVFSLLNEEAHAGRFDRMNEYLTKMQKYQVRYGGSSLPTSLQTQAERFYNRVPFATILFMVNLTMAFLLVGVRVFSRSGKRRAGSENSIGAKKTGGKIHLTPRSTLLAPRIILTFSFLSLTLCLALRWIISGTIPMANGYETMLLMAWIILLLSLLMVRRMPIMMVFGFLMSGFFLLVSHISQMDPQITHIMPVLSSPLLTLHVSIIMMAYALLSLTFLCGVVGLLTNLTHRSSLNAPQLLTLSHQFLYPALTCLGFGIFIGAIWANVSWGTYWSWDPKETWALITLMVYAVAVHNRSIAWLRTPRHYHLYMVLAFLTLLMTYFGVNYFLGGMHSYA